MPKKPRSPEELAVIRANILHHALELINQGGFEGFSMRKLARRLGVSVVTIYNYYKNKDELYLAILTQGFDRLYTICQKAYGSVSSPHERLREMALAFVDFGFAQANFYNLMFTWHVPKFEDYVDTPLEGMARVELETGLKVRTLFLDAMKEFVVQQHVAVDPEDLVFYFVLFFSMLHGFVAGNNNKLLSYIHDDPMELKARMITFMMEKMVREIVSDHGGIKTDNA